MTKTKLFCHSPPLIHLFTFKRWGGLINARLTLNTMFTNDLQAFTSQSPPLGLNKCLRHQALFYLSTGPSSV